MKREKKAKWVHISTVSKKLKTKQNKKTNKEANITLLGFQRTWISLKMNFDHSQILVDQGKIHGVIIILNYE